MGSGRSIPQNIPEKREVIHLILTIFTEKKLWSHRILNNVNCGQRYHICTKVSNNKNHSLLILETLWPVVAYFEEETHQ